MSLISIFSPKGGVGKTTLSLALSDVLSRKRKTCVVEFDFSPGDFASTLDIDKNKNILRAMNFGISQTVQQPYKRKFYAITGGYPDTHEKLDREKLNKFIDELLNMYDEVIFDIQPGLIINSLEVLKRSDKILAIVEDTRAIKIRLARILDWGQKNGSLDISKVFIIANKVTGKLKNFEPDVISYSIPYLKDGITFENKVFEKQIEHLLDVVDNRGIRKGLFSKQPKKVDTVNILHYIDNVMKELKINNREDMFEPDKVSKTEKQIEEVTIVQEKPKINENTDELCDISIQNKGEKAHQNMKFKIKEMEANRMIYINTNLENMNKILATEIKGEKTDEFDLCDIAIVYAASKEEIDNYAKSVNNKKIILITIEKYKEYAKDKNFTAVFLDDCSIPDIVELVEKLKEGKQLNSKLDVVFNSDSKEYFKNEPVKYENANFEITLEQKENKQEEYNQIYNTETKDINFDRSAKHVEAKQNLEPLNSYNITTDESMDDIYIAINNVIEKRIKALREENTKLRSDLEDIIKQLNNLENFVKEKDAYIASLKVQLENKNKIAEQLKKLLADI